MAYKTTESLDTNIILRIMLKDVPDQCLKIVDLFMRQGIKYHVPDLAITEAVYLMQTQDRTRDEIAERIQGLALLPDITINSIILDQVLPFYIDHPKLSFNDCYLAIKAAEEEATPLWTFDQALAKQAPAAQLVA